MNIFSLANDVISFFDEGTPTGLFTAYSFTDHSLIINGTEIRGFHDGDQVIRAEKRVNTFRDFVGIGGEMVAIKSADNTGLFSVQLSLNSVYNGFLEGLYKKQQRSNFKAIEIVFKNSYDSQVVGHRCYIAKPSNIARGKGYNYQEWTFFCENFDDLFFNLVPINGSDEPSSTQRKDIFLTDNDLSINYRFDGVLSESEINESTITEHPVEFGANITDHVFTLPVKYTLSGLITDTTFKETTDSFGSADGFFSDSTGSGLTRSQGAFAQLQTLWTEGKLLSAQTGMSQINNLLIKNISRNMDKDTANALFVDISFQEIIWTDSEVTFLPADKIQVEDRPQASGNVDRGNQQPQPVDNGSFAENITELYIGGDL